MEIPWEKLWGVLLANYRIYAVAIFILFRFWQGTTSVCISLEITSSKYLTPYAVGRTGKRIILLKVMRIISTLGDLQSIKALIEKILLGFRNL
jgi:hypothetical protein